MAALRAFKGSVLEENICRTAGSIGESWPLAPSSPCPLLSLPRPGHPFSGEDAYWKSTALMLVGSIVGVLFVSLVRRVMVEDPELPFPESVAASEIHKAGARGAQAVKFLFYNIMIGGAIYIAGRFRLYAPDHQFSGIGVGSIGQSRVRLSATDVTQSATAGGFTSVAAPDVSPSLLGVGFIIGTKLSALQFAGSVFAWGLLVPLLVFFLGPQLAPTYTTNGVTNWDGMAAALWRFIVRPIAVGGMIVGAAYTLFRMRKSLAIGLGRAFSELRSAAPALESLGRTGALHEFQNGVVADCADVFGNDCSVPLHRWKHGGGAGCGGCHDRDRVFLRNRLGQPGRCHRILKQSNLGPDAVDADHCSIAHGSSRVHRAQRVSP
jgi:putative OPT family oligopeptide transporter